MAFVLILLLLCHLSEKSVAASVWEAGLTVGGFTRHGQLRRPASRCISTIHGGHAAVERLDVLERPPAVKPASQARIKKHFLSAHFF